MLRSKININSFPFDEVSSKIKESGSSESGNLLGQQSQTSELGGSYFLKCNFEVYKLNTVYHYNFDLQNSCSVDKLKFFFEADNKNIYKICVRVLVPD